MRKHFMASVAAAAMVAATSSTAQAGTYIPVPLVPGAVSEIAFSINNSNIVAGSYRDSANIEHGFFGPLDGSNWTTFDAPFEGTTGTEPRYISDDGAITGIALNPKFKVGEEFYRKPDGTFKIFKANGKKLDGIAQGIGKHGENVGDYANADGKTVGYLGQKGDYAEDFRLHLNGDKKRWPQISPRGRTDSNYAAVGFYVEVEEGSQLGFVQVNPKGERPRADTIFIDGAVSTPMEDINESLIASGQWVDTAGNIHAFTADLSHGQGITNLDPVDGSTSQQAWGINDGGLVAMSTNIGQSYIYCPNNVDECPSGADLVEHRAVKIGKIARP